MEESTGAVINSEVFCNKLSKIHRKTSMPEPLFNKVSDLEIYIFITKWLQQKCFPVNFVKFLGATNL